MSLNLQQFADEDFCYLTTTGRRTGRPHTIEIWFAIEGRTLYILSGGREKSDWVKNASQHPEVKLRIRETHFTGQARRINDEQEDALARKIIYDKYTPRDSDDLTEWARTSLPIAIDLVIEP